MGQLVKIVQVTIDQLRVRIDRRAKITDHLLVKIIDQLPLKIDQLVKQTDQTIVKRKKDQMLPIIKGYLIKIIDQLVLVNSTDQTRQIISQLAKTTVRVAKQDKLIDQ